MDLNKVKLIKKIAEKGSISAAASELYISSVAAREQLLLIERDLGFALFKRTRRGASLTPEGEYFLSRAELLLEQFEMTVKECRSMAGTDTQSV